MTRCTILLATFALLVIPAQAGMQQTSIVHWCGTLEIAKGGGHRGPWQQNESRYDYVDDPTVALDAGGGATVAWVDQRRKDVLFQIYDRNGAPRLEQPVNVSRTPQVFSWLPRIALSQRHPRDIYILWQEIVFSGGSHGGDIFFARSGDGGATFGKSVNLSNSTGGDGKGRINRDIWHNGSLDIAVAADGTIYAAWTEYEGALWLSRSSDRGASFSKPLQLNSGAAKPARAPALAVSRAPLAPRQRGEGQAERHAIYLAWPVGEDDRADIHIAGSSDGGRTLSAPRIVAQTPGYSDAPKIAVDGKGVLHLVYAESAAGPFDRYHVRYTRSRDGGRSFEAVRDISAVRPEPVEGRAASAGFPALSIGTSGDVYVLWETYTDHRQPPRGLAFARSRDGGSTFSAPVIVPGSADANGGFNGSQQGLLMRKLDVRGDDIAIVNSSFRPRAGSRVWLMRGASNDCRP